MSNSAPTQSELDLLKSIYPVSRETIERLTVYVDRLKVWQQKTNLVSTATLDTIWSRHIADSLQCFALFPDMRQWADLGSGGGLPGMVLAILLADEDGAKVHLVESNQKKCAFLRGIGRQTESVATIHCGRIESETKQLLGIEVVTARALTVLPGVFEYSLPLIERGAIGLFHKGRDYQREVADCSGLWKFDLVEHPSKVEADSVLLEIRSLEKIEPK
ncbi:MAG: 16S rRNA (guanine(527)-N(7))-methyltransferase RsmG [Hyphomicrobiales bacterium]|nr:MAG: 16S rRNA (guanine(527)-N(7))-methyltransferase RsmG [Hyphomicrobiales bacterium]